MKVMDIAGSLLGDASRLFKPFFDAVDMVAMFPADMKLNDVNCKAQEHGLYFPLSIDPQSSLQQHFSACDYAPASARFGAIVDNVTGMNWQLPGGQRVRLGERVVKSTTGYDLVRFLLHTDGRWGQATDYVLRLRPHSSGRVMAAFHGDKLSLKKVAMALASSAWTHWIDMLNQRLTADLPSFIEICIHCLSGEGSIFLDFLSRVAAESGSELVEQPEFTVAPKGLPDLCLKTTSSRSSEVADLWVRQTGGEACVLLLNGVVYLYLPEGTTAIESALLEELRSGAESLGGHLFGRLAPVREPSAYEAVWMESILQDWGGYD